MATTNQENENSGANGANGAAKSKTEYEAVKMTDGRTVQFPGKRQLSKEVTVDTKAETVEVRFDFRNGETAKISSSDLDAETALLSMGHGLSQKCGDTTAGVQKIDDMYLAVTDMIERLKKGDWAAVREAGDSFSGASIVIRAVCEATGKDVQFVKDFLNGKLEKAKAAGEKLTRNDLYASFRNPNSKTGQIIDRMEKEERAKATKVNADELMQELTA